MVSTPLKNISQTGSLPQVGVKIKTCLKPPPSNTLHMNRNQGSGDTVQDDLLFIKLKTKNGMVATYIYLVHET